MTTSLILGLILILIFLYLIADGVSLRSQLDELTKSQDEREIIMQELFLAQDKQQATIDDLTVKLRAQGLYATWVTGVPHALWVDQLNIVDRTRLMELMAAGEISQDEAEVVRSDLRENLELVRILEKAGIARTALLAELNKEE